MSGAQRAAETGVRPARRQHLAVAVSLLAVMLLALALRAPGLQDVPHLTDETGEVLHAWDIAFAGARPLTHHDAYDGPLWPYLLAGAFRVAGPSAELPRRFALLLGLAVVPLTYALAWALAPRRRLAAATIAGALMATSFTPALVGSRVAWSNCSTPLWTTVAAVCLVLACRRRHAGPSRSGPYGPALVAAGLAGGLALHTHPSVILVLAALAAWFVVHPARRAWLRGRWPWLAVLTALAAYGPMIWFNATTGLGSLAEASQSTNVAAGRSLAGYALDVGRLLAQLGRSLAGGFDVDGIDPAWAPVGWLWLAVAGGAAVALARRPDAPEGRRLPLVVLVVTGLSLPLINTNWHGFLEARYLAFLLPLLYAAVGVTLAGALGSADRPRRVRGLPDVALVGLAAVALAGPPALRVASFTESARAEQLDNRRLWTMVDAARAAEAAGSQVLVDRALKGVGWRAGGHPRRAVEYLLTLESVPYQQAPEAKINHFLAVGDDVVLFLAGATAETLDGRHGLEPLDVAPRPGESAWGLYRSRGTP